MSLFLVAYASTAHAQFARTRSTPQGSQERATSSSAHFEARPDRRAASSYDTGTSRNVVQMHRATEHSMPAYNPRAAAKRSVIRGTGMPFGQGNEYVATPGRNNGGGSEERQVIGIYRGNDRMQPSTSPNSQAFARRTYDSATTWDEQRPARTSPYDSRTRFNQRRVDSRYAYQRQSARDRSYQPGFYNDSWQSYAPNRYENAGYGYANGQSSYEAGIWVRVRSDRGVNYDDRSYYGPDNYGNDDPGVYQAGSSYSQASQYYGSPCMSDILRGTSRYSNGIYGLEMDALVSQIMAEWNRRRLEDWKAESREPFKGSTSYQLMLQAHSLDRNRFVYDAQKRVDSQMSLQR
jgi:hypothetical protein